MRYNGCISFLVEGDREINEYGELTNVSSSWSSSYQCSVSTIRRNNVYRTQDGVEKIASYKVLLPITVPFNYEQKMIRLVRDGEFLGKFEVIDSELLKTQGRIKIVV